MRKALAAPCHGGRRAGVVARAPDHPGAHTAHHLGPGPGVRVPSSQERHAHGRSARGTELHTGGTATASCTCSAPSPRGRRSGRSARARTRKGSSLCGRDARSWTTRCHRSWTRTRSTTESAATSTTPWCRPPAVSRACASPGTVTLEGTLAAPASAAPGATARGDATCACAGRPCRRAVARVNAGPRPPSTHWSSARSSLAEPLLVAQLFRFCLNLKNKFSLFFFLLVHAGTWFASALRDRTPQVCRVDGARAGATRAAQPIP